MKTPSLTQNKVVSYYSMLKRKKEMGFPITLSDIDHKPITNKVKKLLKIK